MSRFLKAIITAAVLLVLGFLIYGGIKAGQGNYFQNASFISSGLMILGILSLAWFAMRGLRKLWVPVVALVFCLQACNYAKSNQQVVISDDCGMNWKKINAGDAVPKGIANPCYMKVVIPNFPMQGDSKFITNLKDQVRASVHIDYDYSIIEPLLFIKQAKFLGKANADADKDEALNPSAFEGAENMVIDKRIKDVSKSLFLHEDIVEIDQAEIENNLLTKTNAVLEPLGVHLNFITLTFDLDEQTRQAIDVSTAMKIYESKGLGEVGRAVMVQRAGATKITVENKTEAPVKQE